MPLIANCPACKGRIEIKPTPRDVGSLSIRCPTCSAALTLGIRKSDEPGAIQGLKYSLGFAEQNSGSSHPAPDGSSTQRSKRDANSFSGPPDRTTSNDASSSRTSEPHESSQTRRSRDEPRLTRSQSTEPEFESLEIQVNRSRASVASRTKKSSRLSGSKFLVLGLDRFVGMAIGVFSGYALSYYFQPASFRDEITLAQYINFLPKLPFLVLDEQFLESVEGVALRTIPERWRWASITALSFGIVGCVVGYFGFRLVRRLLTKLSRWAEE